MQKVTVFVLLFLCLSTNIAHAQNSEKDICAHLQAQFAKIESLGDQLDNQDAVGDSLTGAKLISENRKLKNYIDKIWSHNPATLHMKFISLKKYLQITTSDDGKVRKYSWNSEVNDNYYEFFQFQTGDSTGVFWNSVGADIEDNEQEIYYYKILSIKTTDNKTVYVEIYSRHFPRSHDIYNGIDAFIIDHGKLNKTPFFRIAKKSLSSIVYDYDCQTSEKPAHVFIHLSRDKKKLYIPVYKDGLGFTNKYLVYVFNGNNYVFDKNAK